MSIEQVGRASEFPVKHDSLHESLLKELNERHPTTGDPIYGLLAAVIDQAKLDIDKKHYSCEGSNAIHAARDCAMYIIVGLSTFVLNSGEVDAIDVGLELMRLADGNS